MDKAINRIKNNKTPGPNRATSEFIKLLDEGAREKLLELLNTCWEEEELLEEMSQADLAAIYKKGPTDKPENYRPIALLNIGYKHKLTASMTQKRIPEAMDDRIGPALFGFRKARSTSQPVHIYRIIQDIHEEAGLELVAVLLDTEKAFDNIHQGILLDAPRRQGIPEKVVRVIEAIYRNPEFSVKEMKNRPSERRQHSGIRQGCPLSLYLFIIVMIVLTKDISKLTHERHILRNEQQLGMEGQDELLYADDTIILASSKQTAEIIFHKIQAESNRYNMRLNQNKCILLGMNSLGSVQYLDGGYMPMADRAPYLGTNMSAKGNPHFEISTRIISTTATLNKLDLFWKKAPVSTTWKLRVHDAAIASKLLHGLESASSTNAEYERLDAFQVTALRAMLGITHSYHSHVSNEVVMQTANLRIRLSEERLQRCRRN